MTPNRLVALLVALVCGACTADASRKTPSGDPIVTIASEGDLYSSELQRESVIFVNSPAEFETLWGRIYSGQDAPEFPAVDFERETVVVATPGEQSTGGYHVEIETIEEIPEGVRLRIRLETPGSECVVTEATTTPVHIARVRKLPGVVLLEWLPEVVDC